MYNEAYSFSLQEVLESILDLDVPISLFEDFVLYFSGGKLFPGSVPLSHRYGGHQVLFSTHYEHYWVVECTSLKFWKEKVWWKIKANDFNCFLSLVTGQVSWGMEERIYWVNTQTG